MGTGCLMGCVRASTCLERYSLMNMHEYASRFYNLDKEIVLGHLCALKPLALLRSYASISPPHPTSSLCTCMAKQLFA